MTNNILSHHKGWICFLFLICLVSTIFIIKFISAALVMGTNSGFVEVAPTTDPSANDATMDTYARAGRDTAPVGATKITEIGWYADNATQESNFEVGLYSDAGAGQPELLLYSDTTNAKGTTNGWKSVAVDWAITAETTYWLAVQLDDTTTTTSTNVYTTGGEGYSWKTAQTSLPADWGTASGRYADRPIAIYAIYEIGGDTCTCPNNAGTNWEVDMSDYCVISSSCLCANLTFINIGNFTCNATINASSVEGLDTNQRGYVMSNCRGIDR